METLLPNTYTRLNQKFKLVEINPIAIGNKELLQRKIYAKNIIFLRNGFLKSL